MGEDDEDDELELIEGAICYQWRSWNGAMGGSLGKSALTVRIHAAK